MVSLYYVLCIIFGICLLKYRYRENMCGKRDRGKTTIVPGWDFQFISRQVSMYCSWCAACPKQYVFNLHKTVPHTVYQYGKQVSFRFTFSSVLPSLQALCTSCIDGPSITDALPTWPITGHRQSWLHNRLDTSETQKTKTFIPVLLLSSNCKKRDPTFSPPVTTPVPWLNAQ